MARLWCPRRSPRRASRRPTTTTASGRISRASASPTAATCGKLLPALRRRAARIRGLGRRALEQAEAMSSRHGPKTYRGDAENAEVRRGSRARAKRAQLDSGLACRSPRGTTSLRLSAFSASSAVSPLSSTPARWGKDDHPPLRPAHPRGRGVPGVGRRAQPADGQGRDRRGHLRLGRVRPVRARAGRGRRDRPLPRVPDRRGPDAASGAIWQELYRSQYFEGGRVLHAPRSRRSTSRCTTSRARRWACRSTSCSAASSATTCRASPPPPAARPELIEQAQAAARRAAGR